MYQKLRSHHSAWAGRLGGMTGTIPILYILLAGSLQADIINVPADFETIQSAIDTSENNDTVLVQPGEYVENINFNGRSIVVASCFITSYDDALIDSTIIDGGNNGNVVSFRNGEDENTTLIGFTVTNGRSDYGGGIYCRGTSPTLRHLKIEENEAEINGGGIYSTREAAPVVGDVIIHNNNAQRGGGIYVYTGSRISLYHVDVTENDASFEGGGVYCASGSRLYFDYGTIIGNSCASDGAGVYLSGANAHFSYILITGNSSDQYITTLFFRPGDVEFINVTMVDNRQCNQGIVAWSGSINFVNTILRGNGNAEVSYFNTIIDVSYCNFIGGQIFGVNWGDGNIDEDPLFVDPDNSDYHLTWNSPCIDAGNPDSPEDPDGSRVDIGAFYFDIASVEPPTCTIPFEHAVMYAYPNPFNSTTTIKYKLPYPGHVSLQIYNPVGQRVLTLFEGYRQGGVYSIDWRAEDFSSSVYLLRLKLDKLTKTSKVLLVR